MIVIKISLFLQKNKQSKQSEKVKQGENFFLGKHLTAVLQEDLNGSRQVI
jgi:hypothetical protein